jgi:hypothetical protein
LKIKGAYKMRKTICGVMAAICAIVMFLIPELYDLEIISFGAAMWLILAMALIMGASIYGAEAFIFQQEAVKNGKKID